MNHGLKSLSGITGNLLALALTLSHSQTLHHHSLCCKHSLLAAVSLLTCVHWSPTHSPQNVVTPDISPLSPLHSHLLLVVIVSHGPTAVLVPTFKKRKLLDSSLITNLQFNVIWLFQVNCEFLVVGLSYLPGYFNSFPFMLCCHLGGAGEENQDSRCDSTYSIILPLYALLHLHKSVLNSATTTNKELKVGLLGFFSLCARDAFEDLDELDTEDSKGHTTYCVLYLGILSLALKWIMLFFFYRAARGIITNTPVISSVIIVTPNGW